MFENRRLLLFIPLCVLAALVVMGIKIAYPHHRLLAFVLLGLGWIPLIASIRINQRLLRIQKLRLEKKARPFLPHTIAAFLLLAAFFVAGTLWPVEKSALVDFSPEQLREEMVQDLAGYRMVRDAGDRIVEAFEQNGLLARSVETLSEDERNEIRMLWREGVMAFVEYELLKEKYRGFHQIDHLAQPELHANAFMLAYMAYVAQYEGCLRIVEMVGDNPFMETLLNEPGEGIPEDSFHELRLRITHPQVMLRIHAGAAYTQLVQKDVSIESAVVADHETRRNAFFKRLGKNPDLFVKNPLHILERAAFETLLPVQKSVAVQLSYIRTARRDYLITPEILAEQQPRLRPGDILVQRRNWHMTNIGIPGFWPHTALYIGTPEELAETFSDLGFDPLERLAEVAPQLLEDLHSASEDGFANRVIEAIRPGVVLQSLETSARCDYLGVVRPNLSRAELFESLLAAFSHYGKPYDLNFDFTTDNALVCSELIYKAFRRSETIALEPEIINGRLLLPPNRLVEQVIEQLGDEGAPFSFVLFLDALERSNRILEQDVDAFRHSWLRPKWDILQK